MTTSLGELLTPIEDFGLVTAHDQVVRVINHHQALLLERTVTDALGGEGWAVRTHAAFDAAHALLGAARDVEQVDGADDRCRLAERLFASMGQGKLSLELGAEGGQAKGEGLWLGSSSAAKYGAKLRGGKALDAFTAGYAGAAASLAQPLHAGYFEAEETECVARCDPYCAFQLGRRAERPGIKTAFASKVVLSEAGQSPPEDVTPDAAEATAMMRGVLRHIRSNDAGRIVGFGGSLAIMPAAYTERVIFDTVHLVERRTPELAEVFSALVRESSQMGAFTLLGGILCSEQWRSAGGTVARDRRFRLEQLLGIAAALGWGSLRSAGYERGNRLVLRAAVTPELSYYSARHGPTVRRRSAQFEGIALAIVQLLEEVDFDEPPSIDRYVALRQQTAGPTADETMSPLRGDAYCEVTVSW